MIERLQNKTMERFYGTTYVQLYLTEPSGKIWVFGEDAENRHYQDVLKWVEEGNVIEEMD